jgi:hypothetical protein
MADQKGSRPVEAASAAPGEKRSVVRPPALAKASESGDPAVQKLLGDRWTAEQNVAMHGAAAGSSAAQAAAHGEDVARLVAELAELGFE